MNEKPTVWIRGAGEMASSVAVALHRAGFRVIMSELAAPLAIRRSVSFSEAMIDGRVQVEDVRGRRIAISEFPSPATSDEVLIILDDPNQILSVVRPWAMIDARMQKRGCDLREYASVTVALGPGFIAGKHCDAVIETMRGPNLGSIIWNGSATPDTGIPGELGGQSKHRVIYSPSAGDVFWRVNFGEIVDEDQALGQIGDSEIAAPFKGIVRGLISPLTHIEKGMKIADVDPRGETIDHNALSDKATAVGLGVLEALLFLHQQSLKPDGEAA